MMAAANGHTEIIAALIGLGANIDAVNNSGNSALHWAALTGQEGAVKALVEAKCDMGLSNAQEKTAVMEAAGAGHEKVMIVILGSMKEEMKGKEGEDCAEDMAEEDAEDAAEALEEDTSKMGLGDA